MDGAARCRERSCRPACISESCKKRSRDKTLVWMFKKRVVCCWNLTSKRGVPAWNCLRNTGYVYPFCHASVLTDGPLPARLQDRQSDRKERSLNSCFFSNLLTGSRKMQSVWSIHIPLSTDNTTPVVTDPYSTQTPDRNDNYCVVFPQF